MGEQHSTRLINLELTIWTHNIGVLFSKTTYAIGRGVTQPSSIQVSNYPSRTQIVDQWLDCEPIILVEKASSNSAFFFFLSLISMTEECLWLVPPKEGDFY